MEEASATTHFLVFSLRRVKYSLRCLLRLLRMWVHDLDVNGDSLMELVLICVRWLEECLAPEAFVNLQVKMRRLLRLTR